MNRRNVLTHAVHFTESGLKFSFDVKTTLMISDIAFYPSRTTHGYDLYASAADKEDILFLNLSNGKLDAKMVKIKLHNTTANYSKYIHRKKEYEIFSKLITEIKFYEW